MPPAVQWFEQPRRTERADLVIDQDDVPLQTGFVINRTPCSLASTMHSGAMCWTPISSEGANASR
ncbi:hypothetical protein Poly24_47250 [Rosistilla carotiformis]|uniref:Uncharacterized protein n=1 Tax=Rosistilla carotiformis TaxID=2528017 RepID=A0A518JZL9_9BACT|nr:hypothetical protein Poly24_47250 [Rosistilla carotiformis]